MVTAAQKKKNHDAFALAIADAIRLKKPVKLDTMFPFSPLKPKDGEWYFVGTCPDCKAKSPLIRDPSQGDWNNFIGVGALLAPCQSCGKTAVGAAKLIESGQWKTLH